MRQFVAVTFRADLTRRLSRLPSVLNFVEVAGAEGLFVPTSTDDRWIYGREWHPDRGDSIADWTIQRCTELIRAGTGLPDLRPEILAVMPFVMGGHVATAFRAGRTFLVGDAAHRTTPVGGIGMNTAIHGAHNLGWKLAWVLHGWAGEALLGVLYLVGGAVWHDWLQYGLGGWIILVAAASVHAGLPANYLVLGFGGGGGLLAVAGHYLRRRSGVR